jgi:nucleoside-diphosphate kinase
MRKEHEIGEEAEEGQMGEEEERTLLIVKPDGVQRGLVGEIIRRIEIRGLKIIGLKLMLIDDVMARRHYEEHAEKPFFQGLVDYIKSGPVVPMVLEGKDAITVLRGMVGATDPKEADPGTIRGDYAIDISRNIVHASDSIKSAKREISLFFDALELVYYRRIDEEWI